MEINQGQIASGGIVIGQIFFLGERGEAKDKSYVLGTPQEELDKFFTAHKEVFDQIERLILKTKQEVGEEEAFIFEAHKMMLQDLDLLDFIQEKIEQSYGAISSIEMAREYFSSIFSSMDDEYMKARSADVCDICNQLIENLCGITQTDIQTPSIVVAKDLTPSQTLQMDKKNLLAFVTLEGSNNSHTAILARTIGIPALIQTSVSENLHGKIAIVDGNKGELIVEPDQDILQSYQDQIQQMQEFQKELHKFKGKATLTQSGQKIMLYANAGNLDDIQRAKDNDAEGIGLLRSEFLYLQSNDFPSEEEQFMFYKQALEMMDGKRVIIRTLDIGADKQIGYFGLEKEENPALGYRGIRICLEQEEVFKTQLKALLRASLYGKLAIMFPMIISLWEIQRVKEILDGVKKELKSKQIDFSEGIEIGAMIETPAAALIAQDLAKEVDFLSIGTNDLTQYTLALDRQNAKVARFGDVYHPALLKLIDMTIEAGHRHGCWVGVCGELAQEEKAIEFLIEKGIDELSVSPYRVLSIRKRIFNFF